ncbi:MAG: Ig-like domain-containing protein [Prevotella sp.]|nr:Ig-like domain-containing protein [Prevotella sp.]
MRRQRPTSTPFCSLPDAASGGWTNYDITGTESHYEIAAFIDGQVRAVETAPTYANPAISTNRELSVWRFQVVGGTSEASANKEITFKVWNTSSTLEYDVTATATFTGETPQTPSSPLYIQLTELTSVSLNDIKLNVGETVDLSTYLTLTPAGAKLPNNISWSLREDCASINGNMLTANSPKPGGVGIFVNMSGISANATLYIYQPATSLALTGSNEVTVNVDDGDAMWAFLDNCYSLGPEGTTDHVDWTSGNTAVVNMPPIGVGGYRLEPMAAGDAVLTGTVYSYDNTTARTTPAPITVTVHVKQPVTAIEPMEGISSDSPVECLVGDDLTQYFVNGRVFNVLPANANNKNVTITTNTPSLISIAANGTITALAEGDGYITVTSVDNPDAYYRFWVKVYNEVKDVNFDEETISMMYEGTDVNITDLVKANIHFTPTPAEFNDYWLSITSSNEDIIEITTGDDFGRSTDYLDMTVTAKSAGTATITIEFRSYDYLQATFGSGGGPNTISKSFDVVVSQGVTSFDFDIPALVQDETTEIIILPQPTGASIDDYSNLTVTTTYEANGEWQVVTIDDLYEGINGITAQITPLVPGNITITVTYNNGGETPITTTSDPKEVGYNYEANTGWQWHTIPYVSESAEDIFGSALTEIRTQDQQIYNDPVYGYFGDTDLLAQNVCVKVKMAAAASQALYGGSLGQIEAITLRKGWNWIPNPYLFNRLINTAFNGATFVEGDRLLSKEDGFAEYTANGWFGTLKGLRPGQGYMFYNAGAEGRTLAYADELALNGANEWANTEEQPDAQVADSRMMAPAANSLHQVATRYRDNMSIVAVVEDAASDRYQAKAYVDGELRGEGRMVNGLLFITVHGDAGEMVNLQLVDELTGESFDTDQTVRLQQTVGTVKAPLALSSQDATTGISTTRQTSANSRETFDLGGRHTATTQKGVSLQRQADGSVRKVVVK